MIEMRRAQLSFGDGLITAEVDDLREDWMAQWPTRCWRTKR
jgi:transposase, IS5 family